VAVFAGDACIRKAKAVSSQTDRFSDTISGLALRLENVIEQAGGNLLFSVNSKDENPGASLNACRKVLEAILRHTYTEVTHDNIRDQGLNDLLQSKSLREWIPARVRVSMEVIRSLGNLGSHAGEHPTHDDAERVLREMSLITSWFLSNFDSFSTSALETSRARLLSPPLCRGLASLKKHIDAVTEEQYTVLDFLRLHRRASIVGCAGSGKTLIAMEKATRLVKSGMKTLILCNNPYLADYISQALQYAGVEVDTFCRFVRKLTGTHPATQRWSYFDEPTDAELTSAFDKLFDSGERYDAILVDEAQDFSDGWWLLVEAALNSQEHSFLYVFSDNNQALLPFRAKNPVAAAPVSLTVNCRNAVEIAKIVARFNPNPTRMLDRLGGGTVTISQFNRMTLDGILAQRLGAIWATGVDQSCCVITTEPGSPGDSVLAGKSVALPGWKWQKAVKDTIARHGAILQHRARGYAGPLP
jgi:hypothetical protein